MYKEPEKRKKEIIEFIKKNPKATYKDIRKNLKTHPERIFKRGLKEAFKGAEPLLSHLLQVEKQCSLYRLSLNDNSEF